MVASLLQPCTAAHRNPGHCITSCRCGQDHTADSTQERESTWRPKMALPAPQRGAAQRMPSRQPGVIQWHSGRPLCMRNTQLRGMLPSPINTTTAGTYAARHL